MDLRLSFLNTLKLLHFSKLIFNLSHPIIVDGKKEYLKKLCLVLNQGILSWVLGKMSPGKMPAGKMPPGKKPPGKLPPEISHPEKLPPPLPLKKVFYKASL